MKELKISISDELYEELSNVSDKDSFLAELIENEMKVTERYDDRGDSDVTDIGESSDDLPADSYSDLDESSDDLPDETYSELDESSDDLPADSYSELDEPSDDLPDETYSELDEFSEDVPDKTYSDLDEFSEDVPDKTYSYLDESFEALPDETYSDLDESSDDLPEDSYSDLDESFEDLPEDAYFELEDTFEEEGIVVDGDNSPALPFDESPVDGPDDTVDGSVLESGPDQKYVSLCGEGSNAAFENMFWFQGVIVNLTDRICELEKQIIDMNYTVQSIKNRSVLFDISERDVECVQISALGDNTVTEGFEGAVPYATLSFPELKIPPELLGDVEVPSSGIEDEVTMETPNENCSPDVPETAEEAPEVAVPAVEADEPECLAKDEPVQAMDNLESCIFAYLPFGSVVKKDVIKSLLSKRHADSEVEARIDKLLSSGRISHIVKDDLVYLTRVSEK